MKARFAADLQAPGHARDFVASHLNAIVGKGERPDGNDVVLIVSELVTNAVRAGAVVIDVHLRASADRIDLYVADDAGGWPTPRASGTEDLGGRGLAIVEELADSWQATADSPGKTVTATWYRQG